jgi:hypothetical protein
MRLSEALDAGIQVDVSGLALPRYGYPGDIQDRAGLAAWLRGNPLIDVSVLAVPELPTREAPVRPEQEAFRLAVMEAYEGRCAVTDCDEVSVLEAAHLRSWRGSNTVNDGVLLRVDIHRLFDTGRLTIRSDLVVCTDVSAYREFNGRKLRLPRRRQDWPKI